MAASISASVVTILADSAMRLLPKLDKLIKMRRRHQQDALDITPSRISRPYRITSIRPCNLSPRSIAKFHNHLSLRIETVNMAGFMIFRIRHEPNTIEPERAHATRILRKRNNRAALHCSNRLLQVRNQIALVLNPHR